MKVKNTYVPFRNGKVDVANKVYYKTNEDLTTQIYKDTDFRNKQVLSVVGSGDHIFTANYQLAKRTDGFDISILTLYYYYLRTWTVKYSGELYPDIYSRTNLNSLLMNVRPTCDNEYKALEFFKNMIKYRVQIESMFYDLYSQPQGKTIYQSPKYLKQYMNKKMRFYQMDLFDISNNVNNNTYDIMMISNILDWARGDQSKILIAKENIDKLLNPDGIVLCNNMIYRDMGPEKEIFSENYDCIDYGMNKGYVYKRTK